MQCIYINMPRISVKDKKFRIRSKADAATFINTCMVDSINYCYKTDKETAYFLKKENGTISVQVKNGDLSDIFNPTLELANTASTCYDVSVVDMVYKLRKYINKMWFNRL